MAMDHDYIEEHQVVDRYMMGSLTEAEADLFEDHYLTCDECLRSLDLAQKFRSGFQQVAAEEATGLMAVVAAFLHSRRGLGLIFTLALAACTLLLVRSARLGNDLKEARTQLAQAEGRGDAEAQKAATAGRELVALRNRLEEERIRLEGAVSEEIKTQEQREENGAAPRPQVAPVWLVTLVPVRSGPADEPFQAITLAPNLEGLVLELDLDLAGPDPYRIALRRKDGTAVWSATDLRPGPSGTLAFEIDPSLLQPGDYRLLVESLPADGPAFPAGRFSFRIVK
jgi:hypothetical protein